MQFLLVALNAKYIHSNPALYSLKRFAGKNAVHVQIAEYTINHRMEEILEDIFCRKPDVIAFSCYIWNWEIIQKIIVELHKLLPKLPIWLGGPEVSFDAGEILDRYPQLSGIMTGEGEAVFSELLSHYLYQDRQPREIAGLVLRDGPTGERKPLDMSKIPFLYESTEDFRNRILYYESQRGCPFRCSYCLSSIDKTVRFRDINVVKRELQYFLDNKVKQVKFVDRTFNCNREHAMEIWRYILEHDNSVTNFHFEIAGDMLGDEETALLARMRPGLVQLEIGVQTTNKRTLQEIRRKTDFTKLKAAVETVKKAGNIHQHLDLIAGLPYEDYESFGKSFDEVFSLGPNQLQLGFLKVLKGSYMHEMAEEYGLVYTQEPPYEVLFTRWLSYEEVRRLKRIEEMVEIYYNSNQFTHTLAFLQGAFHSPFAMFEALVRYYKKEGFFTQAPARIYRYQALLQFAKEHDGENISIYRELLVFDLYLREKVKSRPDFAPDLEESKKDITDFYKYEEEAGRYLPAYRKYDSRQLSRMTHMEPFSYPVWDMQGKTAAEEGTYILFDYENRNPLTHEAGITILRQSDWQREGDRK